MNIIETVVHRLDAWQQRHWLSAFVYGVVKKYGDDHGGYQAALLAYFGFLSLFPLLLVLTTLLQLSLQGNTRLGNQIITSTTSYFPIVGTYLQQQVHGLSGKTGVALAVGLLLTLYGAKAVADAFRYAVNNIWHVPLTERSNFIDSFKKSFGIIGLGGAGFILASVLSGLATSAGHAYLLRLGLLLLSVGVLFAVFLLVMRLALARSQPVSHLLAGAAVAAIGLTVLQSIGGFILNRELRHLNSLYGTFWVALGLLFWLYIQTQLVVWAMEVDTVRVRHLWPRSFSEPPKA